MNTSSTRLRMSGLVLVLDSLLALGTLSTNRIALAQQPLHLWTQSAEDFADAPVDRGRSQPFTLRDTSVAGNALTSDAADLAWPLQPSGFFADRLSR